MKKILFALSASILLAGCTMLNSLPNSYKEPISWDDLGGGGIASDISVTNSTEPSVLDVSPSVNTSISIEEIVDDNVIDLSILVDGYVGSNYEYNNETLFINNAGTYELKNTLNGYIEVAKGIGEVTLILNNVVINAEGKEAGILFNKDEGVNKNIILKDNSVNTINIMDTNDVVLEDNEEAGIQSKTNYLTISGNGTLNINANDGSYSGIKAKYLYINKTSLNIYANKNGINSEFEIYVNESNVFVNALKDGIKTNIEPENETDALLYASNIKYGYINIKNSNIDVVCGSASDVETANNGIQANNVLYISNGNDNVINITTNGGAYTNVTETSSDTCKGKAIRADGIEYNDVVYQPTFDSNYSLYINGGTYNINSCSDALASSGDLYIDSGIFNIASGDDGIHAEYLTKINGGTINISNCYEGIEGATVEIHGGLMNIVSVDDAINAANADLTNYSYFIYITGGDIYIDASGDGLDSNGTIKITGGNIYVNGPVNGANAALDADSGILVNGGNIIAVGPSGMVETPSTNSSQCYVNITLSSSQAAGTTVQVYDSNNNELFSYTCLKKFQSCILSIDEFELNKTYKFVIGGTSYSATLSNIATSVGSSGGNRPR